MTNEIRVGTGIELREADGKPVLTGYAAKYGTDSKPIWDEFIETIAPDAFKRTVTEALIDVRALFNHSKNMLLGRLGSKTLRLYNDETGLRFELDVPDTTLGRDTLELVKRGDIYGMSFAFRTVKDAWVYPATRGGMAKRTLIDVDVYDVSPVTDPAYEDTSVAVRSYTDNTPLDWTDTYRLRVQARGYN